MKTLNWRRTDWTARKFIFSIGQEILGELTFYSNWNLNAVYTDKEAKLKFAQKSFWNRNVLITKDEKQVGEIDFRVFRNQTLKLVTGERFILSTNVWGRNVNWQTETGETIVKYEYAPMSSMGKGLIILKDSLTIETEKLLISSGLFIKQLLVKQVALTVVIFVPIVAASNRL